jgi:hypothetical protein
MTPTSHRGQRTSPRLGITKQESIIPNRGRGCKHAIENRDSLLGILGVILGRGVIGIRHTIRVKSYRSGKLGLGKHRAGGIG